MGLDPIWGGVRWHNVAYIFLMKAYCTPLLSVLHEPQYASQILSLLCVKASNISNNKQKNILGLFLGNPSSPWRNKSGGPNQIWKNRSQTIHICPPFPWWTYQNGISEPVEQVFHMRCRETWGPASRLSLWIKDVNSLVLLLQSLVTFMLLSWQYVTPSALSK